MHPATVTGISRQMFLEEPAVLAELIMTVSPEKVKVTSPAIQNQSGLYVLDVDVIWKDMNGDFRWAGRFIPPSRS